MREGRIKINDETKKKEPQIKMIWKEDEVQDKKKKRKIIRAPKRDLPGHAESYHPPPEYLMSEEEKKKKWEELDEQDRKQNFIPKDHDRLMNVGGYKNLLKETFQRCMELYICPRVAGKPKLNINPNDLIPKLPSPNELKPFPSVESIQYLGHTGMVRSLSVDPTGQWLLSGSEDKTAKLWEVSTGRCRKTWTFEDPVNCVEWNPNEDRNLIAVASGAILYYIIPETATFEIIEKTKGKFQSPLPSQEKSKFQIAYYHTFVN